MKIPSENSWTLTQMKGKVCENPKETPKMNPSHEIPIWELGTKGTTQ